MTFIRHFVRLVLITAALTGLPAIVFAWPTDIQWQPLLKGGGSLRDNGPGGKTGNNDSSGSSNIVSDELLNTYPSAYIFNDGVYLFYRLRLDQSPAGSGGQGVLQQFGWGFELDTNQNPDDYEWLIMIDGISSPELVTLQQNTVQGSLGDPSDRSEITVASYPLPGNHRILPADSSINGDQDYFLDFRIPYQVFLSATGLTANSLIRYFAGTSKSTNNLTDSGADLLGGSNLYNGVGDYFLPSGDVPSPGQFSDGTVRFVADIDGFGDVAVAAAGQTIYIRVDDADQTPGRNPSRTLRVELTAPSGDREVVTLTATGVSGKFTGSIPTAAGGISQRNGTLQVSPDEIATVTYLDAVSASGAQNIPRTDTILFTAAATDLGITKTVDQLVPRVGDDIVFTVVVTNYGPYNATGVAVTDNQPNGLTFGVPSAPSATRGSYAAGIWTIGALNVGESATLTIPARVNAGTSGWTITNNASLTGIDQTDGYSANNAAAAAVRIGGTDLRVTKTVSNAYPVEGETISYSIRTVNLGPNAAAGVAVDDLLPAGLTFTSANATQGSYDPATGLWSIGNLASGAGARLTLSASVNAGTADAIITNTASLADPTTYPDTNSANDSASAAIKVNFLDLQLTKKVGLEPAYTPRDEIAANQGNTVRYFVTVNNNGPIAASGITVADLLPAGLTLVSSSATAGTYVPATGIWTVGNLANGAGATLTLTATINAGTAGQTIANSAAIAAVDQSDDNPANNSGEATIRVGGTDLMVTKTASNPTPAPGTAGHTYTVKVRNNGPNLATGVKVTDIPPAGVTFTAASVPSNVFNFSGGNADYVWNIGNLAIGAEASLTITFSVGSGTSGQTITNVAMLTGMGQDDPDTSNNIAATAISVNGTDLGIVKTVDSPGANELQAITYTLTATNHGPGNATNVTVTDLLPPELTYISDDGGGSYNQGSGLWTIGALANGASNSLQITAQVKTGTSGQVITNRATIGTPSQGDPNSANNSTAVDVAVGGTDLQVTKTVSDPTPGEKTSVTYTVTVSNLGQNGATGVEVDDILPAGVTLLSATPSQGNFTVGSWFVGALAAGANATLDLIVEVNSGTAGTTITNTASLAALDQVDPNPANDSASADIVPRQAPSLTVIKSATHSVTGNTINTAAPGQVITYTVTVLNAGSGAATNVVIRDDMSPYTAWGLDSYGAGQPFLLIEGATPSGLTLGTPVFSNDDGATFAYPPVSGGGGAPAGFDGAVTDWRLPMTGIMTAGGSFTLRYKVMVK